MSAANTAGHLHRSRRIAALGRGGSSAPLPLRAQPDEGHRPGRDHGGDVDRRRRMARRAGGRGQFTVHLPDCQRRDRPAGDLQPRDPLHALHRRADLRRIMRLRPGPKFWAGSTFRLLPAWPALAGAAATLFGAWMGRMPGSPDQVTQSWIATGLILFVVAILSFGGTIERMLAHFAWTMLAVVFLFLLAINVAFVPFSHCETFIGFFSFSGLPKPIDWGLIGALAATAGFGRDRQPHGDQLGPRQGLRHGLGRRDPAPSAASRSS